MYDYVIDGFRWAPFEIHCAEAQCPQKVAAVAPNRDLVYRWGENLCELWVLVQTCRCPFVRQKHRCADQVLGWGTGNIEWPFCSNSNTSTRSPMSQKVLRNKTIIKIYHIDQCISMSFWLSDVCFHAFAQHGGWIPAFWSATRVPVSTWALFSLELVHIYHISSYFFILSFGQNAWAWKSMFWYVSSFTLLFHFLMWLRI